MIRLIPDQYPVIQHVIDEDVHFPSVSMLYQRREGAIWVDRLDQPATVVARFPKDLFVWGNLGIPGVKELVADAQPPVADAPGLESMLVEAWGGVERALMIEFALTGPGGTPGALPPGFRLELVRPEHLPMLYEYRPSYRSQGRIGDFRDYSDFFQYGYGALVIEEATNKVISACMAHSVSQERADHSLRTLAGYEGRGFGYAVTYATVQEGVRRGRRPIWITEIDNHGSRRIAERLGFKPRREYVSFNRT